MTQTLEHVVFIAAMQKVFEFHRNIIAYDFFEERVCAFATHAEGRSASKQMGALEVCFNISCAYI